MPSVSITPSSTNFSVYLFSNMGDIAIAKLGILQRPDPAPRTQTIFYTQPTTRFLSTYLLTKPTPVPTLVETFDISSE
jgi:hypothetical protein